MGRQYEASEWVEFFTEPGTPRAATKRLAKKFSNKVSHKFDAWSTKREGYVLPVDADRLAYKTFASIVGHGVGLWDGDLFPEETGEAFEAEVVADKALVALGHELDYAIQLDGER